MALSYSDGQRTAQLARLKKWKFYQYSTAINRIFDFDDFTPTVAALT
jgi:pterin-4a-carbinolamine dehydratase